MSDIASPLAEYSAWLEQNRPFGQRVHAEQSGTIDAAQKDAAPKRKRRMSTGERPAHALETAMNRLQDIDIEREGEKAARGFKIGAIVAVLVIAFAISEVLKPEILLRVADGMPTASFASADTGTGASDAAAAEAYRSMERRNRVQLI